MEDFKTRKFEIENKTYIFDFKTFRKLFYNYCNLNNIKITMFEEEMALKLHVSTSAVHNWRQKYNGPSNIELIKEIEVLLGVSEKRLLKEVSTLDKSKCLTDQQISSVKKIYDEIIEFLNLFLYTNGFNDYWFEFKDAGYKNPEDMILQRVEKMIFDINTVIDKEYIYLYDTDIYDELEAYVNNVLYDMYEGKVSYAYRFEAGVGGGVTTQEDYAKGSKEINEIINKYI